MEEIDKLKKKNNILIIVLLVIILFILIGIVFGVKSYLSGSFKCECEECKIDDKTINTESLDNSNYIGIYSYEEVNGTCYDDTTLVLNSDYSAIFSVNDCNKKSYFYGKYKIEDGKIVLYNIILNDSSSLDEMYIDDEDIYFNIVSDSEIATIYGREESIHLKKIFNVL